MGDRMKLISSLVRPQKVDDIKTELGKINVFAVTVAEVRDYAPQRHETTVWRGHEYSNGASTKVDLRVVVHDDDVDEVVGVIMRAARTGAAGDGSVCVMSVDHRYNICSGLRDVS
jgi:nitrogen regulatory protein P-II 1